MNPTVMLVGASSDIAKATARRLSQERFNVQLVGRNIKKLKDFASDLTIRFNNNCTLYELDILDSDSIESLLAQLASKPDVVVCCVGSLGASADNDFSVDSFTAVLRTNFEGPALFLQIIAEHFKARGSGTIIGISSVAGDRGRASNYIYGSAKAGFTAFLSGLRASYGDAGVHVITVKPGFVRTKMTRHLKLPELLTAQPCEVADRIYFSMIRGNNEIYVYRIWWLIMVIIRSLPENLFKKLKL